MFGCYGWLLGLDNFFGLFVNMLEFSCELFCVAGEQKIKGVCWQV